MSYKYEEIRPTLFTEQGQVALLKCRDLALGLIDKAGAVKMGKLSVCGDSWTGMALVDRLVEIGDLREVTNPDCPGQDRIFVGRYEK